MVDGLTRCGQCVDSLYSPGFAGLEWWGLIDAREMWLLAELYPLRGLVEWLLTSGVNKKSFCCVLDFAFHHEGDDSTGLLSLTCAQFVSEVT